MQVQVCYQAHTNLSKSHGQHIYHDQEEAETLAVAEAASHEEIEAEVQEEGFGDGPEEHGHEEVGHGHLDYGEEGPYDHAQDKQYEYLYQ